jgi:hypothetical protein
MSAPPASGPANPRCAKRVEIRGARDRWISSFELAGGLQQEPGSLAAASGCEGNLRTQEVDPCASAGAVGSGVSDVQEGQGVLERAGFVLRLRRGERSLRAERLIGCESDRPRLECGRGGQASTCLGASGGAFELRGDSLIRAGGRCGEVPGTPIWIEPRIGCLRQRPVHLPPFLRRCRSV